MLGTYVGQRVADATKSHAVLSRDQDDRIVVTITLAPETISALATTHDGVLINLRTSGENLALPPPLTRAVFRTEPPRRRKHKPVNRKLPFTKL